MQQMGVNFLCNVYFYIDFTKVRLIKFNDLFDLTYLPNKQIESFHCWIQVPEYILSGTCSYGHHIFNQDGDFK